MHLVAVYFCSVLNLSLPTKILLFSQGEQCVLARKSVVVCSEKISMLLKAAVFNVCSTYSTMANALPCVLQPFTHKKLQPQKIFDSALWKIPCWSLH